jgi:hypothetical protein
MSNLSKIQNQISNNKNLQTMQVKIKSGIKFHDVTTKKEIKVEKVDLKGVHVAGLENPISLTFAIRSIKDHVWLPKN